MFSPVVVEFQACVSPDSPSRECDHVTLPPWRLKELFECQHGSRQLGHSLVKTPLPAHARVLPRLRRRSVMHCSVGAIFADMCIRKQNTVCLRTFFPAAHRRLYQPLPPPTSHESPPPTRSPFPARTRFPPPCESSAVDDGVDTV